MTAPHSVPLTVIGIGRMGLPIATHLAKSGYAVTVYDIDASRCARAADLGLRLASSVDTAASAADVLITVLPGAPHFEEVMIGTGAALRSMRAGSCWLDFTSNDPRTAARVAELSAARGIDAVGAPMGGGVDAAAAASLEFFVGGAERARVRVAPLLATLARKDGVRVAGADITNGYAAKLLINLLWFGQVAAVTEALLLGERLGLPAGAMSSLIAGSAADSAFAQRHLGRLLDGDDLETFGLRECVDELDIVNDLAQTRDVPFELSSTVARLHHAALARYGDVDGELMVARLLEERAGQTLRNVP